MVAIIAIIVGLAALQIAQSILAPMVLAFTLGIVVSPIDVKLRRWGVPDVLSALLILILTTLALACILFLLQPLVSSLIGRLPELQIALSDWIATARDFLRGVEEISEEIERTVGAEAVSGQISDAEPMWSVSDALWLAPNFAASLLIFVGTLFFFTLTRKDLYRACGRYEQVLSNADRRVSIYFVAVTIVNAGVGVATGFAMMVLGLEHALLWGLAAGILNYVLYLGPIVIVSGLLIAGLIHFGGAAAFLPPAAFVVINMVEAQFVTPWFVGQQVNLNPLVVFLAIVFGLWLWGPLGAIIVLPVLLWGTFILSGRTGQVPPALKTAA